MLQRLVLLDLDVHLLVTRRSNTAEIEQGLQDAVKLISVVIGRQYADEDISNHITKRLQNEDTFQEWLSDLQKYIEEALLAKSAGMFRWVDCQLQAISKCMKPKEPEKAFTSLPTTLREVYAKGLDLVEDRAAEDVRELLEWLTYPQRPYVHFLLCFFLSKFLVLSLNTIQTENRGSRGNACRGSRIRSTRV